MRTLIVVLASVLVAGCAPEAPDEATADEPPRPERLLGTMDDPDAARLFAGVLDSIAPDDGWERTRYLEFDRISGGGLLRSHRWDRYEGDYWLQAPVEEEEMIARFNVNAPTDGQEIWLDGERVTDEAQADSLVEQAYRMFINDTYWLVFPFKWDDPGVTTRYLGEMEEWGEIYEVVELTFDEVGVTPENRYRAFVDPDSGMFELWQFYSDADDEEPSFTNRWTDWQRYGPIVLSSRREGEDGSVGVHFENIRASTEVPEGAFETP